MEAQDITRDDFLAFMIAELSGMKASSGLDSKQPFTTEEILEKFSFDFPLLEESQVCQLKMFLLSVKDAEIPKKQFLDAKFVENVSYLSSSPSYASFACLPAFFGACYVSVPLFCLHMSSKALKNVFPISDRSQEEMIRRGKGVSDEVYANAQRQVFSLAMSVSPSLLLAKKNTAAEGEGLQSETTGDLCALVCALVDVVVSSPSVDSGEGDTLLCYLSAQVNKECRESTGSEVGREANGMNVDRDRGGDSSRAAGGSVVSAVMDLISHLMFLVRDAVTLHPSLHSSLLHRIMTSVLTSATALERVSVKKKKQPPSSSSVRALLTRQVHLLLFHVVTQVTACSRDMYSPSPRQSSQQRALGTGTVVVDMGPYVDLVGSLRESITGLVVVAENIHHSLLHHSSSDSEEQDGKRGAALERVFQSAVTLALALSESYLAPLRGGPRERGQEEVFLSSQLLPFLVRIAFSPLPEDQEQSSRENSIYSSMAVPFRQRFISVLMTLALVPGEGGRPPFTAYVCRSVFSSVLGAEEVALALAATDTPEDSGYKEVEEVALVCPGLLGCTNAAVRDGEKTFTTAVSTTTKPLASSPPSTPSFSILFAQLSESICGRVTSLNRHCRNTSSDHSDHSDNRIVVVGGAPCQCGRYNVRCQKLLNSLLGEVNYTLWAIYSSQDCCKASVAGSAAAQKELGLFLGGLGEAVSQLAAGGCPAAEWGSSTSIKDTPGDVSPGDVAEDQKKQFSEMFSDSDIAGRASHRGDDDEEEKVKNEAVSPEVWREVYSSRKRLTHSVLKFIKVLSSSLKGADDSKTD